MQECGWPSKRDRGARTRVARVESQHSIHRVEMATGRFGAGEALPIPGTAD
ncbi:hypothetical protein LguiA_032260 [Lonicera macranthoides]